MNDLFYIDGYYLDEYQINCVKNMNNLLVIAGAGSGKTSTILGKVKYLISIGYKESDILCISLTNEATNGLKNKLLKINLNVTCMTFHKLGLSILRNVYKTVNICSSDYLEYIINEYFLGCVKYSYRKYLLYIEFKTNKFDEIINSKQFILYKRNILTFINLLKNKDLSYKKIFELYKKSINKIIYLFILEIYRIYDIECISTNTFDFNDMINASAKLVKDKHIKLNYKYIIIDEFQDSSLIKFNLINNIIENNNAKLMCVGDDYQSIYRFAGSDVSLFLNFTKYFKNSEIMYLKNTYRNSKEILYISTKFICKNKYQIPKSLYSNKSNSKPIKLYYSNNKIYALKHILKLIGKDYMIIGRNNIDINYYVDKYTDINNINYFTAHKSKGLESENIILINITDDIMGFPSKIKNTKIIGKLFDKELYKYDEERRLFYVAITRTKNNVYIILDKNNESIFIKELINDFKNYIEIIN